MAALALIAIGVVSLGAGLMMESTGVSARAVFLVNLVYFFGLSFGGLAFATAQTVTLARWGRPLKRIAESFIVVSPFLWLLLAFFLFTGGLELYEWKTHPETLHGHKAVWLTEGFFVVRVLGGTGLLSLLGFLYLRNSLRPDLGAASKELEGNHPAWWGRLIQGYGTVEEETASCQKRMMTMSPIYLIMYATILSFVSFDLVMSLAPHWYSNMFGAWFFASCFWLAMTWTGLLSLRCRGWLGLDDLLTPAVYHDLGKLVFGFSMVWAYMFFAQLLPIWYGNMTEETGFLLIRMSSEPWTYMTRVVGAMCFLIPFITLLSRGIKKMPFGFFVVLCIVATGVWLERYLVAVPSVWMEQSIPLGPVEIGISLGFVGLFLYVFARFISQVPPVPVTDPYMQPHPDDVHCLPDPNPAASNG
jgi:hypothetical protein